MLTVKTKIGPSAVHGIGLFAGESVPKDTVVWQFDARIDQVLDPAVLPDLPPPVQACLVRYAYKSKRTGTYILDSDDARFFNHADSPNTYTKAVEGVSEDVIFAARDILEGEEITLDYGNQEDDLETDNVLADIGRTLGLTDEIDPRLKG